MFILTLIFECTYFLNDPYCKCSAEEAEQVLFEIKMFFLKNDVKDANLVNLLF